MNKPFYPRKEHVNIYKELSTSFSFFKVTDRCRLVHPMLKKTAMDAYFYQMFVVIPVYFVLKLIGRKDYSSFLARRIISSDGSLQSVNFFNSQKSVHISSLQNQISQTRKVLMSKVFQRARYVYDWICLLWYISLQRRWCNDDIIHKNGVDKILVISIGYTAWIN